MASQYWAIAALIFILLLLARILYWRVPQGMGYIRSGWGRPSVILEGGGVVIPGVHRIAGMQMENFTLEVSASRKQSLLTIDLLRVDIELRLLARVVPETDMVLTVQRVFGGDADKVNALLEERCLAVMQTVAGRITLEQLLLSTVDFEVGVNEILSRELAKLGLEVVLVSATEVGQTSQLDYRRSRSVDARALSVLEGLRYDSLLKLHEKAKTVEAQMKKLDFDAAVKKLEWDEQYAVAKLKHQRQKATIESSLIHDIREIELARQLATDVMEQDAARLRLQYQAVA